MLLVQNVSTAQCQETFRCELALTVIGLRDKNCVLSHARTSLQAYYVQLNPILMSTGAKAALFEEIERAQQVDSPGVPEKDPRLATILQVRGQCLLRMQLVTSFIGFCWSFGSWFDIGACHLQTRPLPVRFEDASQFKHKPRQQHPLYQTSSNNYGQARPNQSQLPQQWHGMRVNAHLRPRFISEK